MSAVVNYAATPICNAALLTLASTSRTVPANPGIIFDPGANGGQCHRINVNPVGDTTSTSLRLFKYDGATYHLLWEIQIGPATLVGQTATPGTTYQAVDDPERFPIQLQAGWTLRAAINDAQAGLKVQGEGGGY